MASLQGRFLKEITILHMDSPGESIPLGWEICDGRTLNAGTHDIGGGASSYTLPDLRNRFLLGADPTKGAGIGGGTTNSATDAPGPKGNGGAHSKTLATGELPSHTHTFTTGSAGSHNHAGSTADSGGAHTHTATTSTAGAHTHAGSTTNSTGAHTHTGSTADSGGSHVHTITDPGHTHTISGSGNVYDVPKAGDTGYQSVQENFNVGSNNQQAQAASTALSAGNTTTGIGINAGGAHSHTLTILSDGGHSHTVSLTSDGDHTHTITVASGGAHSHTLTLVSDGAHVHIGTTDTTGSGTAFDTRPRYYGVIYIMKVRN